MIEWRRVWPIGLAVLSFVLAWGTVDAYLRFHFDHESFRGTLVSEARWGSLSRRFDSENWPLLAGALTLGANVAAILIGRWRGRTWSDGVLAIAASNLFWLALWLHMAIVSMLRPTGSGDESQSQPAFAVAVADSALFVSVALGGWLAGLWHTAWPPKSTDSEWLAFAKLTISTAAYAVGFSVLSILQYNALHVPHGDTAMYEEHLWNALHGNGFRSQLDGGRLFLGEHFQFIHLFLIPVYLLYPSLTTLNICQSIALASGAIAVYKIARTFELSPTAAWTLGLGYLLYFPLQYLNLEASWKTFRPTGFCVPLVLFGLLALERHRLWTMLILLSLAVCGEEEYAIVLGAVGVYLICRQSRGPLGRKEMLFGIGMFVGAILFLAFALLLFIPFFREGAAPHYTPYFEGLGSSPTEIATSLAENPREIVRRLTSIPDLQFLLLLLVPLAFLPLMSPGRFAVALPIFGYLMLADRQGLVQPWFHFHGPLVPILFWATAGGIANLSRRVPSECLSRLVVAFTLIAGIWYGKGPFSWKFYDPYDGVPWKTTQDGPLFEPRGSYWRSVYWPQERSRAFPNVYRLIEKDERVASTDYLHPRFTQHRAAHDYPLRPHVTIEEVDVILLDKTEGWWGRTAANPDRELLACMRHPHCEPGTQLTVRGERFIVAYHDPYFLMVRRLGRK